MKGGKIHAKVKKSASVPQENPQKCEDQQYGKAMKKPQDSGENEIVESSYLGCDASQSLRQRKSQDTKKNCWVD